MIFYVYLITNKINGRQYVGFSKHPHKRVKEHVQTAKAKRGGAILSAAIRKYGEANFRWQLIAETSSKERALEIEKECILRGTNLYNISSGGQCGGRPHTEESKRKIGLAHIGRKKRIESCKLMSLAKRGIPKSEEFKQRVSEKLKNDPNISHRNKVANATLQLYRGHAPKCERDILLLALGKHRNKIIDIRTISS